MSADPTLGTSHIDHRTSHIRRLLLVARDIKVSHTIFAMPFALLATFLAAAHGQANRPAFLPGIVQIALIICCMVLARTAAMAVNRYADARLDAVNPRTAGRAIPSGRLSKRFMLAVALASGGGFILATCGFWWLDRNVWPVQLSPLILAWLALYSFTKRFTALCHFFLGSSLALSPVAAALAIRPDYVTTIEPWLLAAMVLCWVAGFDIIYALQDVDVDRAQRLHSLPARLGIDPAIWVSRVLHVASVAALIALVINSPSLGPAFTVGIGFVVALLILEHTIVWRSHTRHINMAFFTLNGVISLLLGGLGIADVVIATQ